MKTLSVEKLSVEAFYPFGFYADLINSKTEKLGEPPVEFFRDMVQQDMGNASKVSFSGLRIDTREPIVDATECHSFTSEGILPIDNDIFMHVGPASPKGDEVPLERFRVFYVPKGTMVVLRPGVWHHGPFTANERAAHILITLPERTYANDCTVVQLDKSNHIKIV